MKKKLFSGFAMLITLLCCLCLCGCGQQWVWHEAKDSTCDEKGNIGYYTFDGKEGYFNKDKVPINELDVFFDALGHDWGDVTYTWSQDNAQCTATVVCANNSNHVQTETVNTTFEVTQSQTCDNAGIVTYTATFTNEAFETQTLTVQTSDAFGHDWGVATYTWSQDNTQCTATRVCGNNGEHVETETVTVTTQVTQEQTCEDAELTTFTATFTNPAFATQIQENVQTKEALGHAWGEVTYTWSQDNSECTATRVCGNNNEHIETETVNATSVVTQQRTCENAELTTYTATFTNPVFAQQTQVDVQTQEAMGHAWGEVSYVWSQDNTQCTARRVCANNNNHVQEETVNTIADVTQTQTCENAEITTYTATFTNEAFETQVKSNVKTQDSAGHNWGEVTYTWSEDNTHCTARRVCINDSAHVQEETVSTTADVTQEQSCVNAEFTTFTATFTNPAFATQIQENVQTQEALGHAWGEATYTWSNDNTECTARRVCGNDETHVETETVNTVANVTQAQSCVNPELTRYTATFTNPAFATQIQENVQTQEALGHDYNAVVTAPTCTEGGYTTHTCSRCGDSYVDTQTAALGHNWGEATYIWSNDNTECTATRVCTRDASHIETETVNATTQVTQAQSCVNPELTTYTAIFTNPAFATQIQENVQTQEALGHDYNAVVTAPTCTEGGYTTHTCSRCGDSYVDTQTAALGHAWGEATYTWSDNHAQCTARRVCANDNAHVETETVDSTTDIEQTQTCEDIEITRYTATFTNAAFATQTTTDITKEALGHNWGEATYTWSQDNTKCTATRVCTRDASHVETEIVDTVANVTQAQSCVNPELTRYTATFTNPAFATQIQENVQTQEALGHDYNAVVTAPTCTEGGYTTHTCSRCGDSYVDAQTAALGHNWGEVTYVWSNDNTKCTATRVCTRNGEHIETETVDTASEVTQEQTCEDIEITRYTATFTNPAFATQTTTDITKEALGHDWSYTYTWSQDNSLCTATRVCENNSEHTDSEAVNTTSVVTQQRTCKNEEITTYMATFTNTAFTTQWKSIQTAAPIGGEHNYVYDADKGKYVCTRCGSEAAPTTSRLRIDGTRVIGTKEITEAELPIVVPYGITEIASHAFEGISISSIIFPDTLRIIGDYAFYECEYLEYFNLPNGLQSIGIRAFSRNQRNNMSQLVIPDTVTSIGKYAFYELKHGYEYGNEMISTPSLSVVLSSSMTVLESGVFGKAKISSFDFNGANIVKIKNESLHYNHLTSITLPASLKMIYDHALNGNHLSNIDISGTQVDDIGLGAFDDQTNITTGEPIQIYTEWQDGYYFGKGANPYYFLVTWDYNVNDVGATSGALIHSDTKFIASELLNLTLTNYSGSGWDNRYNVSGQYEIKQTVGDVIFVSYPYRPKNSDGKFCLKRVDVVEGKTKSQITSIAFPGYLSDYEYGVLTGFDGLTELSVTVGFARLGNFFTDHSVNFDTDVHDNIVPSTLQTVNIIGKITEVESRAFQGLTHVETVNIGPNVTAIASKAFLECTGLKTVLVNNTSALTIGNSAFEECTSLIEFTYNTNYSVNFGEDCFWNTALESFVISSGSTVGNTMLGSCASLMFVYVASDTTITLNGSGNSPFTKCRQNPADSTSNIRLTIYTNGSVDGSNWCTDWNDTSHSTDPKENDQRVRKPATVVYNTTLEAFYGIIEN